MHHKKNRVSIVLSPADGEDIKRKEIPFVLGVLANPSSLMTTLKDGIELIPPATALGVSSGVGLGAIQLLKHGSMRETAES